MASSRKNKKRNSSSTLRADDSASPEEPIKTVERAALSGWPMILGWLAMMIFAFHASTHMVAAGDTWVALACGRHFLHHGIKTTERNPSITDWFFGLFFKQNNFNIEPFSANSHEPGPTKETMAAYANLLKGESANKEGIKYSLMRWYAKKADNFENWPGWFTSFAKWIHPTGWVNQNWLTHVLFYWLTHESPFADAETLSFNTLVYWKFTIYIITVICVYYTTRLLGVDPALSAVFACFAMFIGRSFFDIRPAGFSNMLVAVFLFVLVLATYRNILYIWLIVPVTVLWCNVHGGYIYVFIMLVPFVALNLLTSISKRRFVSIGLKGIYHTVAAGIVAFVAMVLFNPYHLTNLTHTFAISVSKHAERWRDVHEWHPAFDWANPVGTAKPFLVMYIIAWLLLLLWIIVLILTPRFVRRYPKRMAKTYDEYQWPKVDLAFMVIAALTIYMAIRSRRFIPIAAIAACPILAMFIDQIVRAVSATHNLYKNNRLTVLSMPYYLQLVFIIAGAVAVLYFGIWWGYKFKRVYLDPWPTDVKLNSIFMRMTASDAKPFYVGQFIKDNKLKGKMFNYWTEGGFIAWAQEPDPNTGKTPLQLFMDGRAQAAYDRKIFDLWTKIMSGGPTVQEAQLRANLTGRRLEQVISLDNCKEIGRWVNEQLKAHDVWVVLMPLGVYGDYRKGGYLFVKGLELDPDWRIIFQDDKQKLFVDWSTPQAKELFRGIMDGKTIYPNDFSKSLFFANSLLARPEEAARQKGLNFAIQAFKLNPSQVPIQKIMYAARFPELKKQVDDFCKEYLDEFAENKDLYAKQHGYHNKMAAVLNAISYLKASAQKQKNSDLVQFYNDKMKEYKNERTKLLRRRIW